jgi:hypothetical protein
MVTYASSTSFCCGVDNQCGKSLASPTAYQRRTVGQRAARHDILAVLTFAVAAILLGALTLRRTK